MSLPATATLVLQSSQPATDALFADVVSMAGPTVYGTDVWNKAAMETLLRLLTHDQRTIVAIVPQYSGATYYAEYDPSNDAVKVTVKSTGVENATADIHTTTFRFLFLSK